MSHLYPSAKAVKRSAEQSKRALAHNGHALHYFQLFTEFAFGGLVVGALVALISVRRLRAEFEWGLLWLVPLGLAILLMIPGFSPETRRSRLSQRSPRCSSVISASRF